jgi:hypothetical protein
VWLIAVPVLLLAFVLPPALGAPAAAPIAITLSPNELRQPFPALPAGRAPEVSLKKVMKRVALDSAGTLNSRLITIVGFTLKAGGRNRSGTDHDLLLRRRHTARAPASSARRRPQSYPDNTWINVEGTVAPPGDAASPRFPH